MNVFPLVSIDSRLKFNTLVIVLFLFRVFVDQLEQLFPVLDVPPVIFIKKIIFFLALCYLFLDFLFFHDLCTSKYSFLVIGIIFLVGCSLVLHHANDSVLKTGLFFSLSLYLFSLVPQAFNSIQIELQKKDIFVFLLATQGIFWTCVFVGTLALLFQKGPLFNGYWHFSSNQLYLGYNPNVLCRILLVWGMMLYHSSIMCFKNRKNISGFSLVVLQLLNGFEFIMCGSRAGIVSLVFFYVAYTYLFSIISRLSSRKINKKKFFKVLVLIGIVLFLLLLMVGFVLSHLSIKTHLSMPITNSNSRKGIWHDVIVLTSQHPLIGFSRDELESLKPYFTFLAKIPGISAHNDWLQLAMYFGYPVSILTMLFFGLILFYPWMKEHFVLADQETLFLYIALCTLLLQGLVERTITYYTRISSYSYFIVSGYLLYAYGQQEKESARGNCNFKKGSDLIP